MIYIHGMERHIHMELLKKLDFGEIKNIANLTKLEKMMKDDDIVILFNWGKGTRKFQEKYIKAKIKFFPPVNTSLLLANRLKAIKELDTITKYPLERVLIEGDGETLKEYSTPELKNSAAIVLKVGDDHQGDGKYLKSPGDIVRSKYNVVFEEYVDNSRSIRVIIIKDAIFLVEHRNSDAARVNSNTKWIKNINPIETSFNYEDRYQLGIDNIDSIIEDAINIVNHLKLDFTGIDYVVSDDKIGLLEANDMIGLPENEVIYNKAVEYFMDICTNR